MAIVDFSNARIEPVGTKSIFNTTSNVDLDISNWTLKDASGNTINTGQASRLIDQQNRLLFAYYGDFTASGTEFYIGQSISSGSIVYAWKISNISFQSGDSYSFKINATLTWDNT